MKRHHAIFILLALSCGPVIASEPATTIINAKVSEVPRFASPIISHIPANTPVEVVTRARLWCHVNHEGEKKWIKCFNLKFENAAANKSSGGLWSNLTSYNEGSGVVGTIGVRGLDATDLESARPDFKQLERLDGYQSESDAATQQAHAKQLVAKTIRYINAEMDDDEADDDF